MIPDFRSAATALAAFALLLAAPAPAQEDAATRQVAFEDLALSLELPPLEGFRASPTRGEQLRGRWGGQLAGRSWTITLVVLPRQEWGMHDPADVIDNIAFNARKEEGGAEFEFDERGFLDGPYGTLAYAGFAVSSDWEGTERVREHYYLGALAEDRSYSVRVAVEPPADEAAREAVMGFLRDGVRFTGPVEDPQWTEEEIEARWERDRPEELQGKFKFFRTEHYLILTDSSSGKLFGRKMEECYDAIREVYPFEEVPGRKLMPVFVFRTREEYVDFYAKIAGISKESAGHSKGHAWKDYYATYYDSPNDPVHVHEATHQIFSNRLGLAGGGSWFQEGVAEYMSSSHNERKAFAKGAAKRGEFTPFAEFAEIRSLLGSSGGEKSVKGGSVAGKHYTQAASIVAFLMESRFGKEEWPEFLRAIGSGPRGAAAFERAARKAYGVGLDELEAEWVAHWKKAR
jgi:hypothetical protein